MKKTTLVVIAVSVAVIATCSVAVNDASNDRATTEFTATDTVTEPATAPTEGIPVDSDPTPSPAKPKPVAPKQKPGFDGDGTYVVGTDIQPGTYTSGGDYCYWARLKDLDGSFDSIITNHASAGRTTVNIKRSDAAFETTMCNRWVKVK